MSDRRNSWLALAALVIVLEPVGIATSIAQDTSRPNIVFILADDVGQEVLGCYGGTSYKTPHLDALAASGMRFEHCYSMPVCHPTRICLLTGRYPRHLGNPGWGTFPVKLERHTLAHVMKQAGYATAVAGKWQLALLKDNPRHPRQLGFDEYCLFGWHEGPRYYEPLIWQNGKLREDVKDRYGPDVYCEFLVDFMEQNRERPFFVFYSMALCHDVTDDLPEPVPGGPQGRYDSYREMAEGMDQRVGRIVNAVERLGLLDNTLIIFTGDNGTPRSYIAAAQGNELVREPILSMFNGRAVPGGKGTLFDSGTRVPMIASWAGSISGGQIVDDLVDFSDFLPTFADLASAKPPTGIELGGHSFAGRLRNGQPSPRQWAFAEGGSRFFVRTQRWKLYGDGALHDMTRDAQEERPINRIDASSEAVAARRLLEPVVAKFMTGRNDGNPR